MRSLGLALCLSIGAAGAGFAQLAPAGTGGVAALAGMLRQLGSNKRVLMIGAHPDDEDTQLLVVLARGMGAQVAYLSLSRGEGGQNLIGPELGPELGVIRTEELLAARELDGARQFFTRAYDFGYSKSAEETFRFWPRDSILKDVVAIIKRFRPQIIIAVFSGTPADGHGQHQVSGIIARQAFDLMRDSAGGPTKFYRSTRGDSAATTLTVSSGTVDPLVGQSYFQIAAASRSRHRSQDMGQLQRMGPATARVALVTAKPSQVSGASLFAGIDTIIPVAGYGALIDSARAALTPWRPAATLPYLIPAARLLGAVDAEQRSMLQRAIAAAAGVTIDGVTDDGIVTQGQRLQVEVSVWNAGDSAVRVDSVAIDAPSGWSLERLDPGTAPVSPGSVLTRRFVLTVARDAERTQPYFLRRPLINHGGLYDWSTVDPEVRGMPFEPPPATARVRVIIGGERVTLTREIVYRYRDQAIGEVRRPLFVTRDLDVSITPEELVWPIAAGTREPRHFTITVTNRARAPQPAVRAIVTVPPGWPPIPAESLSFTREDETKSLTITLAAPVADSLKSGRYDVRVAASAGGGGSGGRAPPRRRARDHRLSAHPAARAGEGLRGRDPRDAAGPARAVARGLRARRVGPRPRSVGRCGRAAGNDRRGFARARGLVALRRDRDREPGLRNRAGSRGQQRSRAGLREERRLADRPVSAVPVHRWGIRALSPPHRATPRPRDG